MLLPTPSLKRRERRRAHRSQSQRKKRSKTTCGRESQAPFSSWRGLMALQRTQRATQRTSHLATINGVSCTCTTQSIARHHSPWSPGCSARRVRRRTCTESQIWVVLVLQQNKKQKTSPRLISQMQEPRKRIHNIQKRTSRTQLVSQKRRGYKRFKTLKTRDSDRENK